MSAPAPPRTPRVADRRIAGDPKLDRWEATLATLRELVELGVEDSDGPGRKRLRPRRPPSLDVARSGTGSRQCPCDHALAHPELPRDGRHIEVFALQCE